MGLGRPYAVCAWRLVLDGDTASGLETERHRTATGGIWALALGYVSMVGCASLPGGFPLLPRGHDILAVMAFFGVCIGIMQMTFQVTERSLRQRKRSILLSPRLYAGLLAGLPLLPILIAAATQAYVSHARPNLPWVGLEWRVLGAPVYLSFAFWQWITCAVFSAYSVTLCLMTITL